MLPRIDMQDGEAAMLPRIGMHGMGNPRMNSVIIVVVAVQIRTANFPNAILQLYLCIILDRGSGFPHIATTFVAIFVLLITRN
jgi:hypothetical protein